MGLQKDKNEQISVGHFRGKHARLCYAMGPKKNGNVPKTNCRSVFFFVATYGNEVISVGGHKKNTDLRNC